MFVLELEILFVRISVQTRAALSFQSIISGRFSHFAGPPWTVRLEMFILARTLAIPNCCSHRFSLKAFCKKQNTQTNKKCKDIIHKEAKSLPCTLPNIKGGLVTV